MAYYQDKTKLEHEANAVFDGKHKPGEKAPYSGIYECTVCGHEAVSTMGHPLPPHNHHKHTQAGQHIEWKLIVAVYIP